MAGIHSPLTRRLGVWGTKVEIVSELKVQVASGLSSFSVRYARINAVNSIKAVMPMATVEAFVTYRAPTSINAVMGFSVACFMGDVARVSAPSMKASASVTSTNLLRATAVMPMATVVASGHGGAVSRVGAVMGVPTVKAFTGSVIKATMGQFTVTAGASQGNLVEVSAIMPLFKVVASVKAGAYARVNATMPMLRPVPSAKVLAFMPGFSVVAIGHAVVTATYEAYATTMNHDADQSEKRPGTIMVNAVTHYPNYPFNQILRFGNKYYGIGDTGLFLLEGDTDDGQPVAWDFQTTLSDMGVAQQKRVKAIEVGGRVTNLMTATIVVGESGSESYSYTTPRSSAAQNYRQIFGQGVKSRYVGFRLHDDTGQRVEIDTLNIEHYPLTRSI
jgi:hypothetical protein